MIKLVNVSKYYSTKTTITQALRNINLEFHPGEFVAITGESGSGKTTLLNIISGIDTYEDGDIYIDGVAISNFDEESLERYRRDNIAFIFQNNNLIDSYTVLKNVETALVIQGLEKEERIKKAKDIIDKVGLSSRIKHRATKLSGGEKQRLAIARALAMDTKVIIADEPTGSLDSKTGDQILKLLSDLSKDKLVLVVTHNYLQIEKYVTRKIRIYNGEVIEDEKYVNVKKDINVSSREYKNNSLNKAITLSLFNIFGQPKKSIFFILISLILVSFIFFAYSYVLVYVDPAIKDITYVNAYPERLVVKRVDGKAMTDDDYNYLSKDRRVEKVIVEDLILDMKFNSHRIIGRTSFSGKYDPKLKDINPAKIIGRLPEADHEILISAFFSTDVIKDVPSLINQDINFQINDSKKSAVFPYTVTGVVLDDENVDRIYITDSGISSLYNIIHTQNIELMVTIGNETNMMRISGEKFKIHKNLEGFDVCSLFLEFLIGEDYEFDAFIANNKLNMVRIDGLTNREFVYISEELYNKLFPINKFVEEHQYTIHLKNKFDYAKVTNKLMKNGYYVYSPFYDNTLGVEGSEAINEYVKVLITKVVVYLVILVAYLFSYLIYSIVLRTKVKDYAIYKVLGANNKLIRKTVAFEFLISFLFAYVIFFIVYYFIKDMYPILYNYRFNDYIVILIINVLLTLLIARLYLKSLRRKTLFNNLKVMG